MLFCFIFNLREGEEEEGRERGEKGREREEGREREKTKGDKVGYVGSWERSRMS